MMAVGHTAWIDRAYNSHSEPWRMNDLEQECEDAVFEVCDARERFPLKCAEELQNCIKLKNDINMIRVALKQTPPLDMPSLTDQQAVYLNNDSKQDFECFDRRLNVAIKKLDNLKSAMEQVKREKVCEMNKLLRN